MGDQNRPWGVHVLRDMIGPSDVDTVDNLGVWVRAVPGPFYPGIIGRIRASWWVLVGRAHSVIWPEPGDLERAIGDYKVPKHRNEPEHVR